MYGIILDRGDGKKMDKEWFPSLEEYNPRITKEQWTSFVQDKNIFDENSLITFACIQKAKIATCADMAEEFGRSFNFYNTNNWRTGERIYKKLNCTLSPLFYLIVGSNILNG